MSETQGRRPSPACKELKQWVHRQKLKMRILFNIPCFISSHLTFMVHYQSALQTNPSLCVWYKPLSSTCSHLLHILQPILDVMLCVYNLRTVSQVPGDQLQSPLPHSLIFLHFLLWLSLGNRLVTEQRAKEQPKNRCGLCTQGKTQGGTAISNKEWCCVILHKHIISICISFSKPFSFSWPLWY